MMSNNLEFTFQSIGVVKSTNNYKFESSRQGTLAANSGVIELVRDLNHQQILDGLELFDHIWLIYAFHHNNHWKNMVKPPRGDRKFGVFATRSPYRPNPIGMSCVKLNAIKGNKLFISDFDLLNDTPILDIKPYISYCDSFPDAKTGWLPNTTLEYCITASDLFLVQAKFILKHTNFDLHKFCHVQLSENPTDSSRKRIYADTKASCYILAYRTWRINFSVQDLNVVLDSITTGYSKRDLDDSYDQYQDKHIHKEYLNIWKS